MNRSLSAAPPDLPKPLNSTEKPTVVVIGAGLSGLTMAYRLKQKGYHVSVYEARPRVGGRVHTVYVKNFIGTYSLAELGGQNITDGGDSRYLLSLAKELGLGIEEDRQHRYRGFYAQGKVYSLPDLLKIHGFSQKKLYQTLNNLPISTYHSMAEVLDNLFGENSLLKRNFTYYMGAYEGVSPKNLAITRNIDILKRFLSVDSVAAPHEVTLTNEPFLLKHIKGGNGKLPLALAQALEGNVFLNKVLWKVSSYKGRIQLVFRDQTTILCDKLILSIPCTSFQDINWDESLLLKERLEVFCKVQYGLNGKVIVPSDSVTDVHINTDHVGAFHNDDRMLVTLYTDGIWGKTLKKSIQEYYPLMIEMLEVSYGTLQKTFTLPQEVSDIMYKTYDRPIVKSWAEDPYSKGSYSAVGTLLGEQFLARTTYKNILIKALFTPLNDKIFFIGEHTSLIEELGTMEAAVESAERLSQTF